MKKLTLFFAFLCVVCMNVYGQLTVVGNVTDITCNGSNDGSIFLNVTGGQPPYQYLWSNGSTTEPITGLSAGTYTVTVTDANTLTAIENFTITEPAAVVILNVFTTNVSCIGLCDGSIEIIATGGVGSLEFSLDGGNNFMAMNFATNLCAGNYFVVVRDLNNCFAQSIAVINEPQPITVTGAITHATCGGGCDGSITPTVIGGVAPYTFFWSNGQTNPIVTSACVGTYMVTITDAFGCSDSNTFTVQYTGSGNINISGAVTPSACGQNNGAINLTVTGGTPPLTILWSTGETSQNISGLSAGLYQVTVFDIIGCSLAESFLVSDTDIDFWLDSTDIICNSPGSITAHFTGGTAPFIIDWGDGNLSQPNTSPVTNLVPTPGIYTVTIQDANQCFAAATATIIEAGVAVSLADSVQPVGCAAATGMLEAAASGGTPPYLFLWSNSATTAIIDNISAGTYTVTVTDGAGCSATRTFTLPANTQGLSVTVVSTPANCSGAGGAASVSVTGGQAPYQYEWNTGETTFQIAGLPSGVYSVTITDATGCSVIRNVWVGHASQLFYVYLNATQTNCTNNGTITATASNGTPPYSYSWSNGNTTNAISGLAPGTYTLTVTDSLGCVKTATRTINTSCHNVVTGNVFNDLNGDCIKDAGEQSLSSVSVRATNGSQVYTGSANSNGDYTIRIGMSGTFTLSVYSNTYSCSNFQLCGNNSVTFPGLGDTLVQNIALENTTGFDLTIHPGWSSANPGFQKTYWVMPYNRSVIPFTGTATVTFVYDSNLIYQSSGAPQPVHDAVNHTLTWTVNNVPSPSFVWNNRFLNYFMVPVNLPLGYQLQSNFYIEPTSGDCNVSNNHLYIAQTVTGSYDPNEKEVFPDGDILEEDSVLTYTIHFQNTGTDTTHFVILKDTLSSYLDAATVENIASSHDFSAFEISDQGILTWIFNPLYLPDSTTNEPESKGYVMFTVKKNADLPIGTEIENTAAIYFDYNEPIITNTVVNTLTLPVGIGNQELEIRNEMLVYPNPANNMVYFVPKNRQVALRKIELFDLSGRTMLIAEKENSINISRLSQGMYIYRVQDEDGVMYQGKLFRH